MITSVGNYEPRRQSHKHATNNIRNIYILHEIYIYIYITWNIIVAGVEEHHVKPQQYSSIYISIILFGIDSNSIYNFVMREGGIAGSWGYSQPPLLWTSIIQIDDDISEKICINCDRALGNTDGGWCILEFKWIFFLWELMHHCCHMIIRFSFLLISTTSRAYRWGHPHDHMLIFPRCFLALANEFLGQKRWSLRFFLECTNNLTQQLQCDMSGFSIDKTRE